MPCLFFYRQFLIKRIKINQSRSQNRDEEKEMIANKRNLWYNMHKKNTNTNTNTTNTERSITNDGTGERSPSGVYEGVGGSEPG